MGSQVVGRREEGGCEGDITHHARWKIWARGCSKSGEERECVFDSAGRENETSASQWLSRTEWKWRLFEGRIEENLMDTFAIVLEKSSVLSNMMSGKMLSSIILWGPPGSGNTSLLLSSLLLLLLPHFSPHFMTISYFQGRQHWRRL
jgi:hypothetical protein